jgi:SAM-dependent methyltransferase
MRKLQSNLVFGSLANVMTNCPLCSHAELKKSWLTAEFIKIFDFYECAGCGSLVCHPMPDEEILLKMYGNDYFEAETSNMFGSVHDYLKTRPTGTFLDFGCGAGRFAESVSKMGWRTIGVEFSPETVKSLKSKYPFEIVQVGEKPSVQADIIHLADVLEHLTDLDRQFPEILSLLKPGGTVIAHGPLEANPNLFQRIIKLSRTLRGGAVHSPPYHVTLATTAGQRAFFNRFGLEEQVFKVEQIAFPAPETFGGARSAREKGLYLLRKASQILSAEDNGNHYFYIGRRAA